jgi:putative transposase
MARITMPEHRTHHLRLAGEQEAQHERHGRSRVVESAVSGCPGGIPAATLLVDFKGQFRLGNHHYCYPLTISDQRSRYLLACEALQSTREDSAFAVFERAFKTFGLPAAIRSDNGVPFASPHSMFGLSRLSVWWLRLQIAVERIKPGHPQQNGRHERMHLTLKKEATKPPWFNFLQQQDRFDRFIEGCNNERPHQALGGRYPAELYTPSPREYRPPEPAEYPFHDRSIRVTQCGRICFARRKINLSTVFADQYVGIREVANGIWLVSFMQYDLGFFDEADNRVEPMGVNPFAPKLLPMSPE